MLKAKRAFLLAAIVFLTAGKAAAHPATGIVVDRKGQVYFSDLETVWRIDTLGKLSVFRSGVSGRRDQVGERACRRHSPYVTDPFLGR